jgi:hypothetical protein
MTGGDMDDDPRNPPRCPLRTRWPASVLGSISYFIDHVVFNFVQPVDWLGERTAEDGITLDKDNL